MIDLKDIFISWAKSYNPSKLEFDRAKERFDICSSCEFKKELLKKKEWSIYCGVCGCLIKKKVFSDSISPCPKNKWEAVDIKYKTIPLVKNNKSLL